MEYDQALKTAAALKANMEKFGLDPGLSPISIVTDDNVEGGFVVHKDKGAGGIIVYQAPFEHNSSESISTNGRSEQAQPPAIENGNGHWSALRPRCKASRGPGRYSNGG